MIKSEQLQIEELSEARYKLIEKFDKEDLTAVQEDSLDLEIDNLAGEIFLKIKKWRKLLSFEFIIEQLTKLGQAPCLLYDDDGRFALCGDGIQNVSTCDGPFDLEISHFIEKEKFKNTIREALDYYLDTYDDDPEDLLSSDLEDNHLIFKPLK